MAFGRFPTITLTRVTTWRNCKIGRGIGHRRALSSRPKRTWSSCGSVAAAIGGHVIKTGCAPYLIDWIQRGVLTAVALNGAAAIHDVELAIAGKTSEDVAAQLPSGQFGMARETADAFAVAARAGAENET